MHKLRFTVAILTILAVCFVSNAASQTFGRELKIARGGMIEVVNHFGKVDVTVQAAKTADETSDATPVEEKSEHVVVFTASSSTAIAESDLKISSVGQISIEAAPSERSIRIDISLVVPERVRLRIETLGGEVRVSGNLESIEVKTETGTIAADVPTADIKYDLNWTSSRPRFLSDFALVKVKEKSGGKFVIRGKYSDIEEDKEKGRREEEEKGRGGDDRSEPPASAGGRESGKKEEREKAKRGDTESIPPVVAGGSSNAIVAPSDDKSSGNEEEKPKDQKPKPENKTVLLNFTTARGIVLLNVPPNEVSSDLRERPLTNAAKAIIRSGDSLLMEAIRRATPKYFGDYAATLPPVKREPSFAENKISSEIPTASVKMATVRVADLNNRAISDLTAEDFEVTENNTAQDVVSVRPVTAPVNLVLLLDVSGSVDNYVNFIRKAARNFIDTVNPNDRISIVTFNDDVKVLSGFSRNKQQLSDRLDTFDAGGGTAYYDAMAYTLAETLRPLKGEQTAIVILTDGDDNRSFLSFDSLLSSIQESGALVYPLYVPSALIAASQTSVNGEIDPLRRRYMSLSTKAEGEGEKLAKVSGGVYYPITQLSQIQKAYDDIVVQIRTAYAVTYRSQTKNVSGTRASPRLKVKVKRPNAFASIGPVIVVN